MGSGVFNEVWPTAKILHVSMVINVYNWELDENWSCKIADLREV